MDGRPTPRGVRFRARHTEAKTVTYTPDLEGNVTEIDYPSAFEAVRTIDDNNRVSATPDGSSNAIVDWSFHGEGWDHIVMMEAPDIADVDGDLNTSELKRFWYHRQLKGDVTHITDESEVVVESYLYTPYGETTIKDIGGSTVSASQIGNPFMYTGRRLDEETGLYHYRARAYDPASGRFMQRDPREYTIVIVRNAAGGTLHRYPESRRTIQKSLNKAAEEDADSECAARAKCKDCVCFGSVKVSPVEHERWASGVGAIETFKYKATYSGGCDLDSVKIGFEIGGELLIACFLGRAQRLAPSPRPTSGGPMVWPPSDPLPPPPVGPVPFLR